MSQYQATDQEVNEGLDDLYRQDITPKKDRRGKEHKEYVDRYQSYIIIHKDRYARLRSSYVRATSIVHAITLTVRLIPFLNVQRIMIFLADDDGMPVLSTVRQYNLKVDFEEYHP